MRRTLRLFRMLRMIHYRDAEELDVLHLLQDDVRNGLVVVVVVVYEGAPLFIVLIKYV